MYAVKRLQHDKGTWYWVVSFSRRGQRCSRRFYDPMYGGSRAALRAAIAWRDQKLADTQTLSVLEFCRQKRSNNTSGVPGVHFLRPANQPEGVWQARLKLADGTRMVKTFGVRKHGYAQAFDLAVAARDDMLRKARNRPYLHHPVAKRLAAGARSAALAAAADGGSAGRDAGAPVRHARI